MNIVVIGATQGLGLSLTERLLQAGNSVAAGVVDVETPAALQALHDQFGNRLMVFQADVTNEEMIASGAERCRNFLGEIDGLCSVAGVLLKSDRDNTIDKCVIADLRKTVDINAIGAVIVAKHFAPILKKGGKLLTITSEGVGVKSCGTWVPCYGLSKTMATKVSGIFSQTIPDIDFYSIHPGRMNTEMGKTTAQIEASESAEGICKIFTGEIHTSRENWYIDYNGNIMKA